MANLVPPRNLQTTVRFFWPTSQLKCEQREVLLLTAVARSWEDSRGKAFDVFITDVFGSNSSKAAIREAAKGYAPTRVAWVRGTASGHVGSEASALITDVNWVLEGERLAGRGILLPSTLRTTHAQSNVQVSSTAQPLRVWCAPILARVASPACPTLHMNAAVIYVRDVALPI